MGNLSIKTTEADLRQAFERHGVVSRVTLVSDPDTRLPRGFAFVEMNNNQEGNTASAALHGTTLCGRPIIVNLAQPREPLTAEAAGGRQ